MGALPCLQVELPCYEVLVGECPWVEARGCLWVEARQYQAKLLLVEPRDHRHPSLWHLVLPEVWQLLSVLGWAGGFPLPVEGSLEES